MAAALRSALDGSGPALFLSEGSEAAPVSVPLGVAAVVQSSGSTSRPKRVALSADALLAAAAASASALDGQGQWLLALPPTYIAGLSVLVRSITAETEPVVLSPSHFTAERFADAARELDAPLRFTSLVPTQLSRLLDSPEGTAALARFDRVLLGGQATPVPLLERALASGVRVTRTYGSTETAGGCVYDGVPIGATRVKVVDGQLEISGPTLAEGYLDDEERTEKAFYSDGALRWYRTGDAATVEDGVVTVTGRLDDTIISGGLKVSLGELERLIRSSTPLDDAVVVAEDSTEWGQSAVIVSAHSMPIVELRSLAIAALGRAAAPTRLVVLETMPMLSSGKPDRLAIRTLAAR